MSRSSSNLRPLENRQPGQDYWEYVPNNSNLNPSAPHLLDYVPARRSMVFSLIFTHTTWIILISQAVYLTCVWSFLAFFVCKNSRWRTRDPWWFVEERFTGGSNFGIASLPSPALPHAPVQFLLIEAYNPHARSQNTSPEISRTYYNPYDQASAEEESRLSQEDQNKAINKLRKQLYNPHISNIIRRLGTKSTSGDTKNIVQDDIGKRCAVCLEDFESKQFVTSTPCNHMFHEECIVPWVKSQGKCPVCRFILY